MRFKYLVNVVYNFQGVKSMSFKAFVPHYILGPIRHITIGDPYSLHHMMHGGRSSTILIV